MKKFIVEIGTSSIYPAIEIVDRILFDTKKEAEDYFNNYLLEKYKSTDKIAELKDECSGNSFLDNCINDWRDDEAEVYLTMYDVTVFNKEEK